MVCFSEFINGKAFDSFSRVSSKFEFQIGHSTSTVNQKYTLFFDRDLPLAILYVYFCLLLIMPFLNLQGQIGNVFLFLIGISLFFWLEYFPFSNWSFQAFRLSSSKKLNIRPFFWSIICFCTSNGSFTLDLLALIPFKLQHLRLSVFIYPAKYGTPGGASIMEWNGMSMQPLCLSENWKRPVEIFFCKFRYFEEIAKIIIILFKSWDKHSNMAQL